MYQLPAILTPRVSSFLEQSELLFSLTSALGSPLYIILPAEFEHNIDLFQMVFQEFDIRGRIWYACKVNKTQALLEAAVRRNIGVDVASLTELRLALGHGIPGNRIGVSGPMKDPRLLLLAMQHQCTIGIDCVEELTLITNLTRSLSLPHSTDIIVRLSGFEITTQGRSEPAPPTPENGRFGIALSEIPELYQMLAQEDVNACVNLTGFGFHIDNHSVRDRGEAAALAVQQVLHARSLGYPCRCIDIGGGFSVKYVRDDDWSTFLNEYTASVLGERPPVMFRRKSFGLAFEDKRRVNRGNFYPYVTEAYKEGFLRDVLLYTPKGDQYPLHKTLREHDIKLIIEPGKSLVDQAGITVGRIKGVKKSSQGDELLLCDMNISHLFEQMIGSEFAVDPVLVLNPISQSRARTDFTCHIAGNLCLESDMLAWRKVGFSYMPESGDLLAFLNTAGYQMDFIESKMHQMPLAKRVVVYQQDDIWKWKSDEQFSVLDLVQR